MAKRPVKDVLTVDIDALVTVFTTLASFDSSESEPVSVQEMAAELNAPLNENAFALLKMLADAELIEFESGNVWISREDVTEENAEDVAVNALNGSVPASDEPKKLTAKEQAYKERTAYNAAVAASQEPDSQHLHPMEDTQGQRKTVTVEMTHNDGSIVTQEVNVIPVESSETDQRRKEGIKRIMDQVKPEFKAQTPVIAADGTAVTVPVDPENDPKGPRRELDASKGERLILEDKVSDIIKNIRKDDARPVIPADSILQTDYVALMVEPAKVPVIAEETITVKATPKPLPVIEGLDQFIDAGTGDMVYESRIVKNGLALPEPDSIPERPAGVHRNTWDLAHTAITQTARDYWMRKANEEMATYAESVAA